MCQRTCVLRLVHTTQASSPHLEKEVMSDKCTINLLEAVLAGRDHDEDKYGVVLGYERPWRHVLKMTMLMKIHVCVVAYHTYTT